MTMFSLNVSVEERARRSCGLSADRIYFAVERAIVLQHATRGTILDVGCGTGSLWQYVRDYFDQYIGADVVKYQGFPQACSFVGVDLDSGRVPLADSSADVVVAVETIEHLENPRAFVRELVRLAKPGGCVIITTPNQLSLLSKMTLVVFNEFNAFRATSYPVHLTALLEVDLLRISNECGLSDVLITFSECGRVPGTASHYPRFLSKLWPRTFSDNILISGRKSLGLNH